MAQANTKERLIGIVVPIFAVLGLLLISIEVGTHVIDELNRSNEEMVMEAPVLASPELDVSDETMSKFKKNLE
ncbi:hypothetical protein GO013_03095 [Pseudodesulfovibrio sp. JC047]|uniref:hypothetical protein n=1 Tax=Pseudodesulfovibrio sp. JC047 TaxID=2683199 RepID=UPI0013D226D0|nr:hypothetical protein [Pseudodesulfovibrio sp. JC047]NDV18404.1 hypothetical protein [Pseudodesulfovibrio sp. JC047]